jgi:hypothetical protein
MKLTDNWKPMLGLYLIIFGLIGIIFSRWNCNCENFRGWFLIFWLVVGIVAWLFHQATSQPEIKPKKGRKKK